MERLADGGPLHDDGRDRIHGHVDGKEADLVAGGRRDAVADHERQKPSDDVGPVTEPVRRGGQE